LVHGEKQDTSILKWWCHWGVSRGLVRMIIENGRGFVENSEKNCGQYFSCVTEMSGLRFLWLAFVAAFGKSRKNAREETETLKHETHPTIATVMVDRDPRPRLH
jgi:hypothetical protein